jgi:TetR/AcrR family transcriptional repressor of nem operon
MPKPSNREKILTEGLKIVHARGYAGASVRDIVEAAGVPQGSFTNHFASKEAFGLEILDLYYTRNSETARETLRNDSLPPLQRLGAYLDAVKGRISLNDVRNGCLYGNFMAEASEHSEVIRQRLVAIFTEVQESLAYCLRAAIAAGELPPNFNCEEIAGFIISSVQGAILLAKAQRSAEPLDRFKRVLFAMVLR